MIVKETEAKSILSKSQIYDYALNAYVGCQHQCLYCYESGIAEKSRQPRAVPHSRVTFMNDPTQGILIPISPRGCDLRMRHDDGDWPGVSFLPARSTTPGAPTAPGIIGTRTMPYCGTVLPMVLDALWMARDARVRAGLRVVIRQGLHWQIQAAFFAPRFVLACTPLSVFASG